MVEVPGRLGRRKSLQAGELLTENVVGLGGRQAYYDR